MKNFYLSIIFILTTILFLSSETRAQQIELSETPGSTINAIAYTSVKDSSDTLNYIFAGTDYDIFRTSNNGEGWTIANTGLTNNHVNTFLVVNNNIFAGTGDGVFLTTNYGANWVNKGLNKDSVNTLIESDSNIYAGTQKGIFLSSDNGKSWTSFGLADSVINCLYYLDNNIFAGTNNGLFLSSDNGVSWSSSDSGLTNKHINSIVISGRYIYVGTDAGIFLSRNKGLSWTIQILVNLSNSKPHVNCLTLWNYYIFAGTNNGLWTTYSTSLNPDGSAAWGTGELFGNITSVAVSIIRTDNYGNNTYRIFAGTKDIFFTDIYGVGLFEWKDIGPRNITSVLVSRGSQNSLPSAYSLEQNYPNPFNPSTAISYQLSVVSYVTLQVYDILGRKVATLVNKREPPGKYTVNFNGSNLSSGIYFYRLKAVPYRNQSGSFIKTRKMILMK